MYFLPQIMFKKHFQECIYIYIIYLFNFKVLKQLCMGETKNELILSLYM